jgi:hypothetical protein
VKIGLPYMTQIRGGEDVGPLTGGLTQAGRMDRRSDRPRALAGFIAQTFNALVAAVTAAWNIEHNGNDTHSGARMTTDGVPLGRWATADDPVTCSGTMTFTGLTVSRVRYVIVNRMMTVSFVLTGTIGGVASTAIILAVPNGRTVATAGPIYGACSVLDNAVYQPGYAVAGLTPFTARQIAIVKLDQTVFTAGAVSVWGQITVELAPV